MQSEHNLASILGIFAIGSPFHKMAQLLKHLNTPNHIHTRSKRLEHLQSFGMLTYMLCGAGIFSTANPTEWPSTIIFQPVSFHMFHSIVFFDGLKGNILTGNHAV